MTTNPCTPQREMSAEERAEPLFFGPTHVDLDLTNACNLACSHCHAASGKPLPDELSTREICKVLDDLYELGVLSVTIAGGEPFLRPDINTILEHVCQLPGQQVVVVTNGTLLNKQMVDRLARSCPSLKVNVSLDGSTSESFAVMRHRKQRGEEADKALFSRVVNNMLRAAKEGLPTGASFVLSRASAADLAATYELAIGDLGVHDFTAIKFFPAGHGQAFLKDLEFSYSEWRTLLLDLTRVKQAGGFPRMALTVPSPWDLYLPLVESGLSTPLIESTWRYTSPLRESTYAGRHEIGDASGIADLNISGNGDVFASVLMGGQKRAFCGNLRTKTLKEIWWTARPLACLRSTSLADIGGPCPSCSIAGLCGAGSRARALHRFDDLRGMDPSCPRVARYLETAVGGQ